MGTARKDFILVLPYQDPDDPVWLSEFWNKRDREDIPAEHKLMMHILSDAIHVFVRYANSKSLGRKQAFREAQAWVDEKIPEYIFSFSNVCESLGFEEDYLRKGIQQLIEKKADHLWLRSLPTIREWKWDRQQWCLSQKRKKKLAA